MKSKHNKTRMAGTFIFVASVQFLLALHIAETLYPEYSVASNYISDLGVGNTAFLFNTSVILLGALTLAGAYLLQQEFNFKALFTFLVLTGLGAIGVGLFPENFDLIHSIAALVTFLFGGLSAISSFKLQKSPLSYLSIILGVMALVALTLFLSGNYLAIDKGGMERMIAYPVLLWAISFSGYLMGASE